MPTTATDACLESNARYAKGEGLHVATHPGSQPIQPARRMAVVACMDARIDVEDLLGIQTGDAHVIRNAGGVVTDDVIRCLIISHHLLNTSEIVLIHHTKCGMLSFTDDLLKAGLEGDAAASDLLGKATGRSFAPSNTAAASTNRQVTISPAVKRTDNPLKAEYDPAHKTFMASKPSKCTGRIPSACLPAQAPSIAGPRGSAGQANPLIYRQPADALTARRHGIGRHGALVGGRGRNSEGSGRAGWCRPGLNGSRGSRSR